MNSGTTCEFAIVVSDKIQHQGIGTRLMKALIGAARDHGLTKMESTVLRSNVQMLQLMSELGFERMNVQDDAEVFGVWRLL